MTRPIATRSLSAAHDRDWHLINASTCASPLVDLIGGTIVSERSESIAFSAASEGTSSTVSSPTDGNGVSSGDEGFVVIDLGRPTYSQVLGRRDLVADPSSSGAPSRQDSRPIAAAQIINRTTLGPQLLTPVAIMGDEARSARWQYADVQLRKSGKHYVPVAACRG